ncbi:MAG: hypothetical protein UW46_C0006G0019 [Candidatus Yanofskybacteria bacterium GW2011_GWF1_44_227]|uniref:Uncharacterized protein n=1 Tax=Candidatus Yanofskybacteria bacterium GW2011_GWE2_40_11 TaxID=1619033 RepID=A0A0G0QLM0_9BACT|nr:MAG: hypothetical protein UT69_C0002G0014 [Candidatus Yanofskybacteria bacterium GW2011_GWE1_40_10]KKR41033.1 MAG: hypothetical protein UT75_C0002G0070 [Candidatus Yanofskybacteria bacterium GW2011_GWE2_40_11]KKT15466.1 MAG: hypothetical protein UV97_C0006G0033 [Candidatus Yanofskybacteria bacterium GW2011_GWF2_43_596]KKT53118.1 MAG: hypothetical protein UW46_C0006G0019 [Candidatus Yanofskybacteria bacterium GW2011_GWF1_44_227]
MPSYVYIFCGEDILWQAVLTISIAIVALIIVGGRGQDFIDSIHSAYNGEYLLMSLVIAMPL